jgi:hypothetical protein
MALNRLCPKGCHVGRLTRWSRRPMFDEHVPSVA